MTHKPIYDYRYSIIPGGAVTDPKVSMRDLQVLALLGRHTDKKGWCWRSQVEMAEELRCGRATISRSIKRVIEAGWLEAEPLPRGKTVLKEGQQPFSAFKYRVKIDREDEDKSEQGDLPNNGHPHPDNSNIGQGVPTAGGQGVPIQAGTHRRTPSKDQLNALAPDGAEESDQDCRDARSLERWPEFRKAVDETWPGKFPAKNEVAARKAFVQVCKRHDPGLVIICSRLHGRAESDAKNRRDGRSAHHMRHPSNWLKEGDWEGYIPQAEADAQREAQLATALGNVRRAVGEGVFAILKRVMPEYAVAKLDGVALVAPATFTVITPSQRVLLERHEGKFERALGERPRFVMVPKASAA